MGLGSSIKKGLGKVFKPIKKIVKKIVKPIAKGVRKVGRILKKGFGKVAKAFGKLGPLGSIALSLILPGLGGALSGWLSSLGPVGQFIVDIGVKIGDAAKFVKKGVGRVFSSITNGIEMGMNTVSRPFMQKGARGMGSAFRDFVSNATGGAINPSELTKPQDKVTEIVIDSKGGMTELSNIASDAISPSEIIKPKNKITEIVIDSKGGMTDITNKIPVPGATEPTNMWSRLNDPNIGFFDAVKNSDNAKMYGRVTALQTYDYATNPDNLSPDDMQTMRNNGIRATQRAQESLARVDTNNYSTGPAPYQMVNANELGNQDPYGFYLNQIYGQSFANVNQAQQQYLAQNAPGYGATFQDFAMMSYV